MARLPVYVGIFLTPASRQKLIKTFPQAHANFKCDHVTLVFKPSEEELALFDFGQKVRFQAVGYAVDDKGQAVSVVLPAHIYSKNKHPHVTLSVAPGIKPIYSKRMLAQGPIKRIPPISLEGVVDTFPRTKNASIVDRIASRYLQKQADLMPPLGYPGGQCHVVRRIVNEIRTPRLERMLREQVEQGKDLTNPEARKVYDPEKTRGAWKYDMLITPHAQYRMDLRSITEPELRRVLGRAFQEINNERSRGFKDRYDRLMRGGETEFYDEGLDVFIAFTVRGKQAVIITTYRKREQDPKRKTVCPV